MNGFIVRLIVFHDNSCHFYLLHDYCFHLFLFIFSLLILACVGAVNPLVIPHQEMCTAPGIPRSVLIVSFYEADWHACDNGGVYFILIQVYTNEIQIRIDIPVATGYLYFHSDCSEYFLLLVGTVVAVQTIGQKRVTNKSVSVATNLSIKKIQQKVVDNESNHRANVNKHFEIEQELRFHCQEFGISLQFSHVLIAPKQMSESMTLFTNPTSVVYLHYQGSVTHRFWTVLYDLPCFQIYKAYLCPKYALTPVWD